MRILNKSEHDLLERLVTFKEADLREFLIAFLKAKYKTVISTKDYIYAVGNLPIVLVAHMDTVFQAPPTDLFYDTTKNVMWCPGGAGFDDRAGIFAIIQILKSGVKPHIVFTTGEESGGIGASALAQIECPFKDIKFVIQLDRRGTNDCVFYDCYNLPFVEYIEKFGFTETYGSFTDICWLCPEWKKAGVNLSIGYKNEHSANEVLYVSALLATIKKVVNILHEPEWPEFAYIPSPYSYGYYGYGKSNFTDAKYGDFNLAGGKDDPFSKDFYDKYGDYYYDYGYGPYCYNCGMDCDPDEMLEVQMKDGSISYMCIDCVEKCADFCTNCGSAYEIDDKHPEYTECPKCRAMEAKKNDKLSGNTKAI